MTLGYAQTAALTTMVVSMALFLGTCRFESRSVLEKNPLSNPILPGGTVTALIVHLIAINVGPAQLLLGVEPIGVETWILILVIAPTVLVVSEVHEHWRADRRPLRPEKQSYADLRAANLLVSVDLFRGSEHLPTVAVDSMGHY